MSAGAGSLTIAARRRDARTILERLRYDGVLRCSRAFREGDAARVVLSQLGPGTVHGDRITTAGIVEHGAHLIVTGQSATRVLGGERRAESHATWSLRSGAFLELIGEPLVASADARYEASARFELDADAIVVISELACAPDSADVRLRTSVYRAGTELYYDCIDAAAVAPDTVGTLAIVGLDRTQIATVLSLLDGAADGIRHARIGIGEMPHGVVARILANDIWSVRTILAGLCAAARPILRASRNPTGAPFGPRRTPPTAPDAR